MDKKIAKIQKENKQQGKDLAELKTMDKSRDKVCDYGKEQMQKNKKK